MTEAELAGVFSEALGDGGLSLAGETPSSFVKEMEAQRGRPDFVLSTSDSSSLTGEEVLACGALADGSAAELLALMHPEAARTERFLFNGLGVTRPVFRRTLSTLANANLVVEAAPGRFLWSGWFRPTSEFWAVELKLRNWQRALYQALTYRAFAHRSIIVMPMPFAEQLKDVRQTLQHLGVGLAGLDVDLGRLRVFSYPRKQKPRSRAHYLYAIGKYYRQQLGE